jgi:hypothetical protein
MRRAKLVVITVVALSLLCFFTIPMASAQPLNNLWFKLNVKLQGYTVDGATEKFRLRGVAYMHLHWDDVAGAYDLRVYTELLPDFWVISYSYDNWDGNDNFEYFFPDLYLELVGEDGFLVRFYHTAAITVRRDRGGVFRSATYQGWGEVVGGDDGFGNTIFGGITIKGKTIDPSKRPF